MSWIVAGVVGGASLLGTAMGARASNKASSAQSRSASQDLALQRYMYDTSREDLAPFRKLELQGANIGLDSLQALQDRVRQGPGQFKESEGYRFALDQGLTALDKSAVAGGRSRNADTMRFAEGLASNEYDNFLQRYYQSLKPLQSMARVPTGATSQTVGAGQAYAAGGGQALTNYGNAVASGAINQSNVVTGGMNSALNNYLAWRGGGVNQPVPNKTPNPALMQKFRG